MTQKEFTMSTEANIIPFPPNYSVINTGKTAQDLEAEIFNRWKIRISIKEIDGVYFVNYRDAKKLAMFANSQSVREKMDNWGIQGDYLSLQSVYDLVRTRKYPPFYENQDFVAYTEKCKKIDEIRDFLKSFVNGEELPTLEVEVTPSSSHDIQKITEDYEKAIATPGLTFENKATLMQEYNKLMEELGL